MFTCGPNARTRICTLGYLLLKRVGYGVGIPLNTHPRTQTDKKHKIVQLTGIGEEAEKSHFSPGYHVGSEERLPEIPNF